MATEATNGAAAEVQSVTFTGLKPQVFVEASKTEDIEAAVDKAVKAGAEGDMTEGEGAWFGGRVGKVKDPYGIVWLICAPAKKCDVEA
ncbi:hypothetical protein Ccrd_003747 [Cynara cardunculus var. scolymus]|uniref:VOC domain-containing protein n=1 Tax=Cynara cardunculus var. scolymus TaxID=59895 RepID=A0A118JVK5_CYNCS|nr:hypothetical protein Ccrd_003747 [Cynara cardunculus var. scolymus]